MNEEDIDGKYLELVNRRGKIALKYLNLIAKMTGSRAYNPNSEQVAKLTLTFHDAVDKIQTNFENRNKKTEEIEDIL